MLSLVNLFAVLMALTVRLNLAAMPESVSPLTTV
jgi:hypothetical protein